MQSDSSPITIIPVTSYVQYVVPFLFVKLVTTSQPEQVLHNTHICQLITSLDKQLT